MDMKIINMKKSVLVKKEFTSEFVHTWQYIVNYTNSLLFNLSLYEKIIDSHCSLDEIKKFYNIFYGNTQNERLILQNIKRINLQEDYNTYKVFVTDELKRCKPFIEMYLDAAKSMVSSLKMTKKRIDSYNIY